MPIYFVTADGPQHIPEDVIAKGAAATTAYIAEQGWQPPPPPSPATSHPAPPAAPAVEPEAEDTPLDEEG